MEDIDPDIDIKRIAIGSLLVLGGIILIAGGIVMGESILAGAGVAGLLAVI